MRTGAWVPVGCGDGWCWCRRAVRAAAGGAAWVGWRCEGTPGEGGGASAPTEQRRDGVRHFRFASTAAAWDLFSPGMPRHVPPHPSKRRFLSCPRPLRFVDEPALAAALAEVPGFRLPDCSALHEPRHPAAWPHLDLRYRRPATLGEALFNTSG